MSGRFRIPGHGLLVGAAPVPFRFQGRAYTGLEGDTLASALMAEGIHLLGRSFKYHRPRGIFSAGSEEPNALVDIRRPFDQTTPNTRATTVELYKGLDAKAQNAWPSLAFDMMAMAGWVAPLLPAGFYYKTFMWPRAAWRKLYEPAIRAMAGLGRAPERPDTSVYANQFAHCDVLIVGGGLAGLSAALEAGTRGQKVILCDEHARFGGTALADAAPGGGQAQVAEMLQRLQGMESVLMLPRTTAFGAYEDQHIALAERLNDHLAEVPADSPRERLWQVRPRHIVLATGTVERPLLFADNDRPGILLAGAARRYLNHYGVAAGHTPILAGGHDGLYDTAFDYAAVGIRPVAVLDSRAEPPAELVARAEQVGIPVYSETRIRAACGRRRVSGVIAEGRSGRRVALRGDCLLVSGGYTPVLNLHAQLELPTDWRADLGCRVATTKMCNGVTSIGACTGAGLPSISALSDIPATGKTFVDLQNDVTARDIDLAVREGFGAPEHVKRYTTLGMATDQGKTSNVRGMALAAAAQGVPLEQFGLTKYRPPFTPVSFGTLSHVNRGALYVPERRTPLDGWADAQGAVFEPVGLWRRAQYFPGPGEKMASCLARECRLTRSALGLFDASTLGKIEVVGPDAGAFLDLIYTGKLSALKVGRCRYGLMLNEEGYVMDDGVIGRVAEDRYHVTTTTGGAPAVLAHMERYLQTEFAHLQVWLTSTTEQWAVIALNGPRARDVLAPLVTQGLLDNDAFPHMSLRETAIAGVAGRLFRVSFTGELGFELNVPSQYALEVWRAVLAEAERGDYTVYGTETMHILRAEKGYIIVGQDTDGTRSPADMGLSWAVSRKKKDFIGARSLDRPALSAEDRPCFVGFESLDGVSCPPEGAQVLARPVRAPEQIIGHITSSYPVSSLGRPVILGLAAHGRDRLGEAVWVSDGHREIPMRLCDPVQYDQDGGRLNG